MGDYPRALPLFEQARDLRKRLLTENHPAYAASLSNLALLYQAMGDYGRARPLLEQARDLRKRLLTENHPLYALSLSNLAAFYRAMGDYGRALPLLEQARDLDKQLLTENHPDYATSLSNVAALHQAMGRPADAALSLQRALRSQQVFLDQTFAAQSDRQRLDLLQRRKSTLNAYLSLAADGAVPAGPAYEAVLAWKGALAARQAEERLARDRPALQPLATALRQARAGLAKVALGPPASPQLQANWLKRFDDLEARKERLEADLARQSDAYRRSRELRHATAVQVARALPQGGALVDFIEYTHYTPPPEGKGPFQTRRKLLAFVLVPSKEPVLLPLGSAASIDRAVQAWRQAVTTYQPADPLATSLAQRLWRPLREHLADVRTVLIAPDGPVCGLPFGALPGEKANSFLLEEKAIGYVTSGRHLLELAAADQPPAVGGLLAVGDPAFGEPSARPASTLPTYLQKPVWQPLPGTRLEAERIAQSFRDTAAGERPPQLLTGAEADAAHLIRALSPAAGAPRWRYVHLATHGYFEAPLPADAARAARVVALEGFGGAREYRTLARNPLLRSGLVLAGANAHPDDGVLTAEQVADLDLRGTELVVLSACETGLGKVAGGEGVLGLQRAFQATEARALVVSLWSVHDAATSVLMEEFYANLWHKKLPRLEALRQAQMTVLRDPARVRQRRDELRPLLVKRGVAEAALVQRGFGKTAQELPEGGRVDNGRSPPAWWAAFVLSGDGR
jgi:CHAT domain-containing protein